MKRKRKLRNKTNKTAQQAKKSLQSVHKKMKKFFPDHILPKNIDRDQLMQFARQTYEKTAHSLAQGAQKVGATSRKVAYTTRKHYELNSLKVKIHFVLTRIGEYVENLIIKGEICIDLNEEQIKSLMKELSEYRTRHEQLEKELFENEKPQQ
ncbi:MAG: hypothetical protein GF384_01765 [Elusimicrobia bacterium]|nr:hypothetical protein [Elusimicrobiota bacterium]MBD3411720.1 hypothetical protein [Elusimicrobiota bacterium]